MNQMQYYIGKHIDFNIYCPKYLQILLTKNVFLYFLWLKEQKLKFSSGLDTVGERKD